MIPPRLASLSVSAGLITRPLLVPPLAESPPPHAARRLALIAAAPEAASARRRATRRPTTADQYPRPPISRPPVGKQHRAPKEAVNERIRNVTSMTSTRTPSSP